MGFMALLNQAVNFAAPAFWLALLLPWLARVMTGRKSAAFSLPVQIGVVFLAGLVVLVLGLMLLGQDGKMLTYLALVLTAATGQWLMRRR